MLFRIFALLLIFAFAPSAPALISSAPYVSHPAEAAESGEDLSEDDEEELEDFFEILKKNAGASMAPDHKIDYSRIQEDPLETVKRGLSSMAEIEWDEEEMIGGGAPDIVKKMKWPINIGFVGRGMKRRGRGRGHAGVDLIAPKGTNIIAVLDGVVEAVSNGGAPFRGYGKVILINHGGKLWTLYSHNSANKVKTGMCVKQGQIIALVGSTGRTTTSHLHFEVRNSRGTPLDPMKYLPKEGRLPNRPR